MSTHLQRLCLEGILIYTSCMEESFISKETILSDTLAMVLNIYFFATKNTLLSSLFDTKQGIFFNFFFCIWRGRSNAALKGLYARSTCNTSKDKTFLNSFSTN